VLLYGDRALLVELASSAEVAAYTHALRSAALAGVVELVPAARTVLVRYEPSARSVDALRLDLAAIEPAPMGAPDASGTDDVVIDVRYDGEDLAAVAALCDTTIDDVIRRHQGATYHSAFCGFAPGFAYLTGIDERLTVPRLDTPRPRVASGSVAIAGEFAGIYPNEMPGGWRILGHTDAVLWDLARPQPALLAPGTSVRFRSVDG
jgi:KipI family sensor histidine kinase inhibitor